MNSDLLLPTNLAVGGVGFILVLIVVIAAFILPIRRRRNELERKMAEQKKELERALQALGEPEAENPRTEEEKTSWVPEVPEDLMKACAMRKSVLFWGTGLSALQGQVTWREMIAEIIDDVQQSQPRPDWSDLRSQVNNGDPYMVAEVLKSRLEPEVRGDAIRRSVESRDQTPNVELKSALRGIPFTGVLTNTFDSLSQQVFRTKEPEIVGLDSMAALSDILREHRFFILRTHGDLEDADSLDLTTERYRQAIYENTLFGQFIQSLVTTRSFLFMGCSLDWIRDFFASSQIHGKPDRQHFALVPDSPDISLEAESFLSRYNVQLISYGPSEGHPEVIRFAEMLATRVAEAPEEFQELDLRPETLKTLKLSNIGPFEELNLEFQPHWNVLLGDNGCGKSTILRSIALALCGNDDRAEATAQKLLRAGADVGSVELTIGSDSYKVLLNRDSSGVRVRSRQVTLVQSGSMLALGFPTLRGGHSDAKAPTAGIHPNVHDLLPLLTNSIDMRLGDLKDWLIRIDAESKNTEKVSAERAESCARMRDSFFELIAQMTPGVEFSFSHIDNIKEEIYIKTSDGLISLDKISQGMSSVFGWVGTVLRRLYEIHSDEEKPEQQEALVLLDEIDAHLHPEWQSDIIPILYAAFPNLQVIATTHSPLVIGGLDAGEVSYLRRNEGEIECTVLEESFRGWRADQILTHPVFGLSSSQDRGTREQLAEYRELLAVSNRSKKQVARFNELSEELDNQVPTHHELLESREAAKLMREWMTDRLSQKSPEQRERILQEAELYLAQLDSGD